MNIGVYGLGRFGSFWAKILAEKGHTVYGYSRHKHEEIPGVIISDEETVLSQDNIFYCVSISAFREVIGNTINRIKSGALIMDTCSVKLYPVEIMEYYMRKDISYLPLHPMFGPDSGKDSIENLPIVVCPLDCPSGQVRRWKREFSAWGLNVISMSPDVHDKQAAYSQGVTHFVGRTLEELGMEETELATKGYKSLMTIMEQTCNDPIQLFYDLQRYNPYAKDMRLNLKRALMETLYVLESQETAE